MAYSELYSLIQNLEYGTGLHIAIDFLGNRRNSHCAIPQEHTIHYGVMCDHFKNDPESFKKCRHCSMTVLNRVVRTRRILAGMCINGIYEYTRPILIDGKLVCVVRIGNILTDEGEKRLREKADGAVLPFDQMEWDYPYERCQQLGDLIEGYIGMLFEKYPEEPSEQGSLILNIKQYIKANLPYDMTVASVSRLFGYNEAYLGRLFKQQVGCSVREYINRQRIRLAQKLLLTNISVTAVAQQAGYNNVAYFNRVFKTAIGQTPSGYRRQATRKTTATS